MSDFSRDPIINTVFENINRGIRVALEHGCLGSAVVLILSGMDAMAFLGMPEQREEVTKDDFISWAKRYIRFPCEQQLSGEDLYGARCAALHNFGSISRMSRQGKCRHVVYMSDSVPEVRFNPAVSRELVLVSVPALANAFFSGVNEYLIDLFADPKRAKLAEKRFEQLLQSIPVKPKD